MCIANANVVTFKGVGYRGVEALESSYPRILGHGKKASLAPVPFTLPHKLSCREKKSKKFEPLKKRNI